MNKNKFGDIISLGAVFITFVLMDKLFKNASSFLGTDTEEAEDAVQDSNDAATEAEANESALTYPKSNYYDLADSIYTALQASYFIDEDAIYQTFRKLKNNADYVQLKLAYGERPHGFYGFRVNKNMVQSLRSDLDEQEIFYVNRILADTRFRNIKYRI
jgi:hypothetical protein